MRRNRRVTAIATTSAENPPGCEKQCDGMIRSRSFRRFRPLGPFLCKRVPDFAFKNRFSGVLIRLTRIAAGTGAARYQYEPIRQQRSVELLTVTIHRINFSPLRI